MSFLYDWYKRHEANPVVASVGFWLWNKLGFLKHDERMLITATADGFKVKAAFICDQMTYDTFSSLCDAAYLTPANWKKTMETFQPDFLFCESAWSGISEFPDCWRGQIYRKTNIAYEQRQTLKEVLDYCHSKQIPTVFWNKEDTVGGADSRFDFQSTALLFDYIFTTSEECCDQYRERGASKVDVLPFAFAPKMYNPLNTGHMPEKAIFAGSWYSYRKWRCQDTRALIKSMEEHGIPCVIYDRNWNSPMADYRFPEDLKFILKPGVKYTKLPEVSREYLYALNINTIKDSNSMFARRVYEMMAQNHVVISNDSKGMRTQFPDRIGFVGEAWDADTLKACRRENLRDVFEKHTLRKRFSSMLEAIGFPQNLTTRVWLVCGSKEQAAMLKDLKSGSETIQLCVAYPAQDGCGLEDDNGNKVELCSTEYVVIVKELSAVMQTNWKFALSQMEFLPMDCGVRCGADEEKENSYTIVTDEENTDCIFGADRVNVLLSQKKRRLQKYIY